MTKTPKPNVLPARRFELVEDQIVTHFHGRTAVLADRAAFPRDSGEDVAERVRLLQELIRRANAYHERYIPKPTYEQLIELSRNACDPKLGEVAQNEAEQRFYDIAGHYMTAVQFDDYERECALATNAERLAHWCRALGIPTEQVREVAEQSQRRQKSRRPATGRRMAR